MSDAQYGYGQMSPYDTTSDTNIAAFICRQLIARLEIMKLVKVVAVHPGSGSPPAPGTVDVQPLVRQIDYNGFPVQHGIVNGIAFWRFQFGPWAIVADPKAGDVGYVICADRDSSLVLKSAGQLANPGSRRKFSLSDGIYVGGIANAVPDAWFWLKSDGTLQFQDSSGNALTTSSGGFAWTTSGDFTVNSISVLNHTHPVAGIQTGSGDIESGPPTG